MAVDSMKYRKRSILPSSEQASWFNALYKQYCNQSYMLYAVCMHVYLVKIFGPDLHLISISDS